MASRMTTPPAGSSQFNWKDHPVVIAAGSVAATLLFAWNFIVPLKTAELEAELSAGKKQIEALKIEATQSSTKMQGRIDELSAQKRAVEGRLKETVSRLSLYESKDTFVSGEPYPFGISAVKLGEDYDTIDKAFPNAEKSKTSSRIQSVSIDHAIFSGITYYKERAGRGRASVIQIVYKLKNEDLRPALDLRMNAAFGSPKEVLNGNKAWNVKGTSVVLLKDAVSISALGTRPGSWDDD